MTVLRRPARAPALRALGRRGVPQRQWRAGAGTALIWLSAACLGSALSAQSAHAAARVTPSMLNLERDPAETLAHAQAELDKQPPPQGEARLQWLLEAMVAAVMQGQPDAFKIYQPQVEALAAELKDAYAQALLMTMKAGLAGQGGRADEATELARAAIAQSAEIKDELARTLVRDMAAWALMSAGHIAEAEPHLRAALDVYQAQGATLRRATTLSGLGRVYSALRDREGAYEHHLDALRLLEAEPAPYLKAYVAWELGVSALLSGRTDVAHQHFEQAISEAEKSKGLAGVRLVARQGLGLTLADQGEWREAQTLLEAVQPKLKQAGLTDIWILGQVTLARAVFERGGRDWETLLAPARAQLEKQADGDSKVQFLEREAALLARAGRHEAAYRRMAEVLALERKLYSKAQHEQLSALLAQHEVHIKQLENSELRLQQALAKSQISEQATEKRLLLTLLALGALGVAILAYLWSRERRHSHHFSALALTDTLTGAPNRRAILERLEQLLAQGQPGVVGLLDMDHFKQINDRFGHTVGDRVLQAFYQASQAALVPGQTLGRLGGEEWLVIAPGVGVAAAETIFQAMQAAAARLQVEGLPAEHALSFSMGACAVWPGSSVSELLARTDAAMYQAKAAGRNCMVLAPA